MSTEKSNASHGLTFLGALQVLFIGLKLTGNIDWPWAVVLLPTLAELVLIFLALVFIIVTYYRTPHW